MTYDESKMHTNITRDQQARNVQLQKYDDWVRAGSLLAETNKNGLTHLQKADLALLRRVFQEEENVTPPDKMVVSSGTVIMWWLLSGGKSCELYLSAEPPPYNRRIVFVRINTKPGEHLDPSKAPNPGQLEETSCALPESGWSDFLVNVLKGQAPNKMRLMAMEHTGALPTPSKLPDGF